MIELSVSIATEAERTHYNVVMGPMAAITWRLPTQMKIILDEHHAASIFLKLIAGGLKPALKYDVVEPHLGFDDSMPS